MNNKIFISHSSKDINIIGAFVEKILVLGLEIPSNRIFCSSMEGHGIKSGQYIPARIKEEIKKSSLVLLFISKNYKNSEVCLNEVGASWITLEEEKVIPILLPDVNFNEIGFLNLNKLGIKINSKIDLLKLINDNKDIVNTEFDLARLERQLTLFLSDFKVSSVNDKELKKQRIDDFQDCFEKKLDPFNEILRKTLPEYHDGVHEVINKDIQHDILFEIGKLNLPHTLWYKFSHGDFYIKKLQRLPNGNYLINSNWEIKISAMFVYKSVSLQDEFILIKTDALEPYKITSDIGGTHNRVGILNDGSIIHPNEFDNGYAKINGKSININEFDVELRYSYPESFWIFIATYYHDIGYNTNIVYDFCKKIDKQEIDVTPENLFKFSNRLNTHPTVFEYR